MWLAAYYSFDIRGVALALLALAAAAVFVAVYVGLLPPASARVIIRISGGSVRVTRGVISAAAREHVQMLSEQYGIRRATIGITPARKVTFSLSVPARARQPIRNVLLNM